MSDRFSYLQIIKASKGRTVNLARYLCFNALIIASLTGVSVAQDSDDSAKDALFTDAAMYAADWNVSQEEAVRRLNLQDEIGKLNTTLSEQERDTFAGLWIEHQPEYRVVVRVTTPSAEAQILDYVRGTELEGLVEVSLAKFSLEELEASQVSSHNLAAQSNMPIESEINLQANRVQLYLPNNTQVPQSQNSRVNLNLPDGAVLFYVKELSTPEVNIYGGLTINGCTSAFSVRNSSGFRGITTAAHCPDNQFYNGSNLTFQSQDQAGNQDVQWHTAPGFTVTNQFNSGTGIRNVTATRSRSNQAVGNYVCKNGRTTGYTCGNISSTTFIPNYVSNAQATFIRVHNNNNNNLSEAGDSGGPWFNGNTAYGIHSGGIGNDAIYMPINYVSSLGISVLTSP